MLLSAVDEDARIAQQSDDTGTAHLQQELLTEIEEDAHHIIHLLADESIIAHKCCQGK